MSESHIAYIVRFKRYQEVSKAIVIASSPDEAEENLLGSLDGEAKWGLKKESIEAEGLVLELLEEAEENGMVEI